MSFYLRHLSLVPELYHSAFDARYLTDASTTISFLDTQYSNFVTTIAYLTRIVALGIVSLLPDSLLILIFPLQTQ
jgi:hypothetical protein